ncbi:MAG: hypothetical protein IIW93_05790 [Bacteroidaceae bacterium]|nr:hypothetical protein [Bacteroidaceae bacterium]
MKALLITIGYVPYTFSEALCNAKLVYALQQNGWEVDVISRVDDGHNYSTEWQEPWMCLKPHTYEMAYPLGNKITRTLDLLWATMKMGGYPLAGIRWARRAYQQAVALHKEKHYDLVLTRSPSDVPHIVGYKLKQCFGVRWIANWNDPSATIWPEPYTHHFSASKAKMLEKYTIQCLKGADVNTFPSQSLLDHFTEHFPFLRNQETKVIPHIALWGSLYTPTKQEKKDKLYLCHSGNLSAERNPELLFRAMREMVDEGYPCMQLDIMGHINDYTRDLIDKYRLADYVGCAGSFPYLEAVTRLLDYDVLVLLEARLQRGIFFASKFTDYAQSTRPILAVSPKEGFAHDMITKYGGGVFVDNEDYKDIKRGLLELYKAWEADTLDSTYSTQRLYAEFSTQKVVDIYNKM